MNPDTITIHNTWNDAPASNEIEYMQNNNTVTGFHIAIDDKEVIIGIPLNRNAYHAGDGLEGKGNRKSIGIEICYSKSGGARYVKAEQNTIEYVAKMLHERGWGTDRVKQHYDWSKKNCPHRIRDEKRWDSFISQIKVKLNQLKGDNMTKFKDVPKTHGSYKAIERGTELGLYGGYADGTFKPNEPVTRAQMASMLVALHDKLKG